MTTLTTATTRPAWTDRVVPRPLVCVALAAGLAALAFAMVFLLRIGPVIAVLDAAAGRGVHTGDLWAVPAASASALFALLGVPPRRA